MLDRDRLGEFNFGLIFRFSRIGSTLETLDLRSIRTIYLENVPRRLIVGWTDVFLQQSWPSG